MRAPRGHDGLLTCSCCARKFEKFLIGPLPQLGEPNEQGQRQWKGTAWICRDCAHDLGVNAARQGFIKLALAMIGKPWLGT